MLKRTLSALSVLLVMSLAACADEESNDSETDATQDVVSDAGMDDTSMDDASMDDASMDDTSMDDAAEEDVAVATSLRDDVFPIIESKCAGCHTRGTPTEDWEGAVENERYYDEVGDILALVGDDPQMNPIIAGDSAASGFLAVLRQEFTFGDFDLVMPPEQSGAPPTRAADIEIIAMWIDEGALDN